MGSREHANAPRKRIPTVIPLAAILLLGFALRVAYLTADRLHADEALYAGWALLIRDGDPFLVSVPVDKPPLSLYTLAGSMIAFGPSEVAARLPSLAASTLGIALLYRLGRRLYGQVTGIWAALFLALSPFDILFGRTAFTDPMLVLWMLSALCAVATGRWFGAGLALGLAFATKQHAALLFPLVAAVGWVQLSCAWRRGSATATLWRGAKGLLAVVLGFALPFSLVTAWDAARWPVRPGYWAQSAMSYGGLSWATPSEWGGRLVEWLSWARYLTGSPALGAVLLVGCAALLVHGWRCRPRTRQTWLDTLFAAYALGYLGLHAVLQFSMWDRYLLPLAPLVGLLLARIVSQTGSWLAYHTAEAHGSPEQVRARPHVTGRNSPNKLETLWRFSLLSLRVLCVSVVFLSALLSGWKAAHNGYPIGGEHWAYQGLDQVAAYLRGHAPPNAVLYHHWLRWHYTYYLYAADFELRWWQSGEHLRREAMRTPERAQYIVLPDWRTLEPNVAGVHFRPVYQTRRQDGSVSLRVYRVEPLQLASWPDQAEEAAE